MGLNSLTYTSSLTRSNHTLIVLNPSFLHFTVSGIIDIRSALEFYLTMSLLFYPRVKINRISYTKIVYVLINNLVRQTNYV